MDLGSPVLRSKLQEKYKTELEYENQLLLNRLKKHIDLLQNLAEMGIKTYFMCEGPVQYFKRFGNVTKTQSYNAKFEKLLEILKKKFPDSRIGYIDVPFLPRKLLDEGYSVKVFEAPDSINPEVLNEQRALSSFLEYIQKKQEIPSIMKRTQEDFRYIYIDWS